MIQISPTKVSLLQQYTQNAFIIRNYSLNGFNFKRKMDDERERERESFMICNNSKILQQIQHETDLT